MRRRFRCERHPEVNLVPIGFEARGGARFICPRCCAVITAGEGLIRKIDLDRGVGEIITKGDVTPLVFLFSDNTAQRLRPAEPVSFEYGVAEDSEKGKYMRAALKVRPLLS